jgi:Cu+-exporting ATPase
MSATFVRPLFSGLLATVFMLGVYVGVLGPLSGWEYTVTEFFRFWPYLIALAVGFGVQIGLYVSLKQQLAQHHGAGHMVAATGTTSAAAMISCCSHYLMNVLPVVGAAGAVTLVAQYQVELFWLGLAFNAAGIIFVGSRLVQAWRHA